MCRSDFGELSRVARGAYVVAAQEYFSRRGRDISIVACSSPTNFSASGSHRSSRPSISVMLHKWQVVIVR